MRAPAGWSATPCTPTATPARSGPSPPRPRPGRARRSCCAARRRPGLTSAKPRPERRNEGGASGTTSGARAWKKAEAAGERRLDAWSAREDARLAVGTPVGFTGFHDAPVDGQVAVATDSPWVLGRVSAPTRIATYGDTPAAMDVLVEVLLGQAPAPGRLPVRRAGRRATRLLTGVAERRSEGLDEQGRALPGDPGEHQGGLVVPAQGQPLAQLLGDDLHARAS